MGQSLFDEIVSTSSYRVGPQCAIKRIAGALTPAEHADLSKALELGLPAAAISRALIARGHKVKPETINRHRRGECACDRTR